VFGSQGRSWNTEKSRDEFFVSYLWSFKHLTVDQAQIPPLSSQVKAFFNLPPLGDYAAFGCKHCR